MIEELALDFIKDNNQLMKYLKEHGKNLSNEELLEIKNKREEEFNELLKTILCLQNNIGHLKN